MGTVPRRGSVALTRRCVLLDHRFSDVITSSKRSMAWAYAPGAPVRLLWDDQLDRRMMCRKRRYLTLFWSSVTSYFSNQIRELRYLILFDRFVCLTAYFGNPNALCAILWFYSIVTRMTCHKRKYLIHFWSSFTPYLSNQIRELNP